MGKKLSKSGLLKINQGKRSVDAFMTKVSQKIKDKEFNYEI
jgi:hypothetical protein